MDRSSSATHEASYIPFLFSAQEDSVVRPKGRRTFNAKGHEVKEQLVSIHFYDIPRQDQTTLLQNEAKQPEDQIPNSESEHASPKRITSISGFKVPPHSKPKNSDKGKTKTALEMILEDARTGPSPHLQPAAETGFVKPVGVDGPSAVRMKAEKASSASSLKREREPAYNDASNVATNKKRRKKKEVQ